MEGFKPFVLSSSLFSECESILSADGIMSGSEIKGLGSEEALLCVLSEVLKYLLRYVDSVISMWLR